ncbi:MAG TPA: 50S ribosomal protein L17 [Firmicutes bacterium]|nr:50S ribosomal protein L17 [Bacillota bacterium]
MRHRVKGRRLGRTTSHRKAMLANLATSLIEHGGINTTDAKAKELRPFAEKLVTLGKRGDLTARRRAMQLIRDKRAVKRLFDDWAPRFQTRTVDGAEQEWNGGYVRILKLGRRKGDAAEISMIEFVTGDAVAPEKECPAPAIEAKPSEKIEEKNEGGE